MLNDLDTIYEQLTKLQRRFDNLNEPEIPTLTELMAIFLRRSNNLSDVASASTSFANIKQDASETATGVVERATQTEVNTGTDTDRYISPATLSGRTATDTRTGVIELATQAEVDAGTDTSRTITPSTLANTPKDLPVNGRLTLTTAVPVTTADVTAATTIYYSPYQGNRIALYTGSFWKVYTFSEVSLSLSGFTAGKNNDIFIYDNAGTITLERVEWTNDTTRATALTLQDGILVKSGTTTKRYVGTFRTTASTGQCEDSVTHRYVWNYYNRVEKHMLIFNGSNHTYDSTWRAFNNDQANSDVEFVIGVVEEIIRTKVGASLTFTAGGSSAQIGPGLNSLTSPLSQATFALAGTLRLDWVGADSFPALGYNYLVVLEQGGNTGADPSFNNMTLWGEVRC